MYKLLIIFRLAKWSPGAVGHHAVRPLSDLSIYLGHIVQFVCILESQGRRQKGKDSLENVPK